jgi:hypothetical protein
MSIWAALYCCIPCLLVCLDQNEVELDKVYVRSMMDTTINYKVRLFPYLYSNFGYTSFGSRCTCRYLNVGTNVSQSASPSKLNFQFAGSPIVLHWEGHYSFIRSAIEVNEHLMESLFDNLSNRSSPTSYITLSRSPNYRDILLLFLSGAMASSQACYSHLGPRPKVEHAPRRWRTSKRYPGTSSSLATTLGG